MVFSRLKKLFAEADRAVAPPQAVARPPESSPPPRRQTDFLCREPVFDRDNRPLGHLFHLPRASYRADGEASRQAAFDAMLLEIVGQSPPPAGKRLLFLPIASSSLALPAIDALPAAHCVLLVQLASGAEPDALSRRLGELRVRGFQIGLFRQPAHPAFPAAVALADFAALDVATSEPDKVRDFSAALRASGLAAAPRLLACGIETDDEHALCRQWHFTAFHGPFTRAPATITDGSGGLDPHKTLLLRLIHLLQDDELDSARIADQMKQDPALVFRVLRYLNSPALGLSQRVDSLTHALIILGRQRLARWLGVLLFSVRPGHLGDWLRVETALVRARLMELLAAQVQPRLPGDALFLTGLLSCLDRLLRKPLPEALAGIALSPEVRQALLERQGPYLALLALAEAGTAFDLEQLAQSAAACQLAPDSVNRALLAATAWASEVSEDWD